MLKHKLRVKQTKAKKSLEGHLWSLVENASFEVGKLKHISAPRRGILLPDEETEIGFSDDRRILPFVSVVRSA